MMNIQMEDVAVEILYNKLYRMFVKELINLNIGYNYNKEALYKMNELINVIDYIKYGEPDNEEIIKIIQYYE